MITCKKTIFIQEQKKKTIMIACEKKLLFKSKKIIFFNFQPIKYKKIKYNKRRIKNWCESIQAGTNRNVI